MKGFLGMAARLALAGLSMMACESEPVPQTPSEFYALRFDPSLSDSIALRLAEQTTQALGGDEAFARITYLSFHYVVHSDTGKVVDWRHDWNRTTNDYRLEGRLSSDHIVAYFNLNSQQNGQVFLNGKPAGIDEAHSLLGMAYTRFINDTYWLLMPFKLKDAGAKLEYRGMKESEGVAYEVLKLSFVERVGLTPENSYHIYVDPNSHLIKRWEYFQTNDAPPIAAEWENWQNFGEIKLATERILAGVNRKIVFTDIIAATRVDSSIFEVPSQISAGSY